MRLGKHAAMVGLATATISFAMLGSFVLGTPGCSTPPPTSTGNQGTSGTTGGQGTAGSTSQGNAGSGSQAGDNGSQGTAGAGGTNSQGTAGSTQGTAGASGTQGTAGASGTQGTAGASGTQGTAGAGGTMATAGTSGGGGATACPANVKGHCNADTGAVDKYAGFTLNLAEEFDAPVDLDADPVWTWSDGGPPEGQARFQEPAITFANGQMIITATATNVPAGTSYAEPAQNMMTGTAHACAVQSGEFRTKYNNYRYGRYEAKLTAPIEDMGGADGNYLSTLFAFRTPKWQDWNEIDIELEANIKNLVAWNMVNAQGRTGYPADKADAGNGMVPGVTGFNITNAHTYAFEWTPTKVVWYTDGVMIHMDSGGAAAVPTKSAKIMMNLWVFASAAAFGNPANNKYPFHATYDYFRFYKWNMETTYPVADPKTLPTDDTDYSKNNPKETTYP
jgi:hypothetical protein